MRLLIKRFVTEFSSYQQQLLLIFLVSIFFIFTTNTHLPFKSALPIVLSLGFAIVQITLLMYHGNRMVMRFLLSFLSPLGFTLGCLISATFHILIVANIIIWLTVFTVALLQSISLVLVSPWRKYFLECLQMLAMFLAISIFYMHTATILASPAYLPSPNAPYNFTFQPDIIFHLSKEFFHRKEHIFILFCFFSLYLMILQTRMRLLHARLKMLAILGKEASAEGDDPNLPKLENAQQMTVTVLATSIADFANYSELLDPRYLVSILNRYYALWAVIARKYRGHIVKQAGDRLTIIFGTRNDTDATEEAYDCAKEFMKSFQEFNAILLDEQLAPLPSPSIGIHTGMVILGALGIEKHKHVQALGEASINAERINQLCKELKQDILISQSAMRMLPLEHQSELVIITEVLLSNSTEPVTVYGRA